MEVTPTQFSLTAGLTLRIGARTIELVRQIDDDNYHWEDTETRRPKVISREEILKGIYDKKYQVVMASRSNLTSTTNSQESIILDLSSLTEVERRDLDHRLYYVKGIMRQRISRGRRETIRLATEKLAAKLGEKAPSTSAIMKWLRSYELSGFNAIALVSRYRVVKRVKRKLQVVEDLVLESLKKHYFTRDRNSAVHAYRKFLAAASKAVKEGNLAVNDGLISYTSFTRRIREVDYYQRIASREGPRRAAMLCRTTFPHGHPSYPLQRVEIDHTPLNWVVVCDRLRLPLGRPTLSLMVDSFSVYPLGIYLSFYGPGVTSVCGLVRNALRPKRGLLTEYGIKTPWLSHGMGDEWVVDNGLEFHSFAFNQIAKALGVDLMFCKVQTPFLKPHVERSFGNLNELTLKAGRVRKSVTNGLRADPYRSAAILFSDLVKGLLHYFVEVFPHQQNRRKAATPYELFSEGLERCPPAVYPGNLDQLTFATGMSKTLVMNQGGIELLGLPFGSYGFKEIANRNGSRNKVLVKWDPDDMSKIFVQDPQKGNWIEAFCRWEEYADGLSLNQHKLIRANAKGNSLNAYVTARENLDDHWQNCSRGYKRADALKAARFADYTSSRVSPPTEKSSVDQIQHTERSIIVPDDTIIVDSEVPEFETFAMARQI